MLSIVMPTYRSIPRLRLALTTLLLAAKQEAPDADIIVVNDGGSDVRAVVDEVSRPFGGPLVRVLDQAHAGRSAARNRGAEAAVYEHILFLDGDVLVRRGALAEHRRRAAERTCCITRGTIFSLPWLAAFEDPCQGTLTEQGRRSLGSGPVGRGLLSRRIQLDAAGVPDESAMRPCLTRFENDLHCWLRSCSLDRPGRWVGSTGGHLSVPRQVFLRVKGFDVAMGRQWGAEDLEFGYRAEREGIPLVHASDAAVVHIDHEKVGRAEDHRAALNYFAGKHRDSAVTRLTRYFEGGCSLQEVFA